MMNENANISNAMYLKLLFLEKMTKLLHDAAIIFYEHIPCQIITFFFS